MTAKFAKYFANGKVHDIANKGCTDHKYFIHHHDTA